MKGYMNDVGYMGYVMGDYILFASEEEYFDYIGEVADYEDEEAA